MRAVVDVVDERDVALGEAGLAEAARRGDERDRRDEDQGEDDRKVALPR